MEYQSAKDHGNADAVSHLLAGSDDDFDMQEGQADGVIDCNFRELSSKLNHVKPKLIAQEKAKGQSPLQSATLHQRRMAK